ncbi:MAG: hypothetical protein JJE25_06540 [Bacteroidia bacterium]|nr:hypothetical protein [Bacteroidia bacterium]
MAQKRLRIFAGPNGSGKSSMLRQVKDAVPLGNYINADVIENLIAGKKSISFSSYGITGDSKKLYRFFDRSGFVKSKSNSEILKRTFEIAENEIKVRGNGIIAPEYAAAIIAEFLREENLHSGNDFSIETVMSHTDKIDFIKKANDKGYHVYMYFICTDDVRVNVERVKTRVKEGGHSVPEDKIKTRYKRTLNLLNSALKICYKSYLFDNSDKMISIARINRDNSVQFQVASDKLPGWFIVYVLNKNV